MLVYNKQNDLLLCFFFVGFSCHQYPLVTPPRAHSTSPRRQVEALRECKEEVMALCDWNNCNPISVRLVWHDAVYQPKFERKLLTS